MFTAVPAVITTRSPDSTSPACAGCVQRLVPEILHVDAFTNQDRRHPPLDRQLGHRPEVVRQRDDRPVGSQPGDRGCRAAGKSRDEKRLGAERLGEVARRVRHRLPDGGIVAGFRELMPVAEGGLDGLRDLIHVRDGLDGVLADSRLPREHQSRGAVEDRVGHVAGLRPRRLGLVHHRLQHLRRGDHGLPTLEARQNDPLLDEREGRDADLDAEVTARDHHGVGLDQDRVQRIDSLGFLDLRDHVSFGAGLVDERSKIANVGGRAHERERHEVDAEVERELEVVDVLSRQRRNRHGHPGDVHTLVCAHEPTVHDQTSWPCLLRPPRPEVGSCRRRSAPRARPAVLHRSPPARSAALRRGGPRRTRRRRFPRG